MTRRQQPAEPAAERRSEASTGDRDQAAAPTVSGSLSALATTSRYALIRSDGLSARQLAEATGEPLHAIDAALKELSGLGLAERTAETWFAVEPLGRGRRRVHVGHLLRRRSDGR